MSFIKNQIFKFAKSQGVKAGIVPVKTPENEKSRVEEVNRLGILNKDLERDRRFNNITQIAAYLTDYPKSSINILDDKFQITKGNYGFNVLQSTLFEQAPRDITLCQYILETPKEQLIINDIDLDVRTKNMKNMVIAPELRFYAGSPLITSKGFTIGTLCVMDKKPGKLEHFQAEGLRLLADQVISFCEIDYQNSNETNDENINTIKNSDVNLEANYFSSASILFTDFIGFTKITETIEPGELIATLDEFFIGFDKICKKYKIKKVKTIGDSYMAVGGVPEGYPDHPKQICLAALDIAEFVNGMNIQRKVLGKEPWKIRIGVHTGPIIAGNSGENFDIWGDSVNIASRIESSGEEGKVHISNATFKFIEEICDSESRGDIELKNKGSMKTYFLNSLN